ARLGENHLAICTKEDCNPDYVILKELKELYEVDDIFLFSEGEARNFVAGLYREKKYIGIGLIKGINDRISLESAQSEFDTIEIGEIRLEGGRECFIKRF
ncbi:MAG: hypothetical protein DSO00_06105, partial [Archaeoglobi archaeon]